MSALLKVGDKVRTRHDGKSWWSVQVAGGRYTICIRQAPFKAKGEYLYTILDSVNEVQGPCNLIGNGWDVSLYKTPEIGWRDLHVQLLSERVEISRRQSVSLKITEVKAA